MTRPRWIRRGHIFGQLRCVGVLLLYLLAELLLHGWVVVIGEIQVDVAVSYRHGSGGRSLSWVSRALDDLTIAQRQFVFEGIDESCAFLMECLCPFE